MKIVIETIPHSRQRYDTVGDYWIDKKGVIQIRISNMKCDICEKMVAVHELVEFIMTDYRGISEQSITDFDKKFEAKRKKGNKDEPGFDKFAPYKNEHSIATAVELMICAHLNIAWQDYDKKVNSL